MRRRTSPAALYSSPRSSRFNHRCVRDELKLIFDIQYHSQRGSQRTDAMPSHEQDLQTQDRLTKNIKDLLWLNTYAGGKDVKASDALAALEVPRPNAWESHADPAHTCNCESPPSPALPNLPLPPPPIGKLNRVAIQPTLVTSTAIAYEYMIRC